MYFTFNGFIIRCIMVLLFKHFSSSGTCILLIPVFLLHNHACIHARLIIWLFSFFSFVCLLVFVYVRFIHFHFGCQVKQVKGAMKTCQIKIRRDNDKRRRSWKKKLKKMKQKPKNVMECDRWRGKTVYFQCKQRRNNNKKKQTPKATVTRTGIALFLSSMSIFVCWMMTMKIKIVSLGFYSFLSSWFSA